MKVLGTIKSSRKRISLRLPEKQLSLILQSMKKNGYGSKERSKWIEEAISGLLELAEYWDLVAENFTESGGSVSIPITLEGDIYLGLEESIDTCKRENIQRVDKSAVVRAAITQRLITEGGGVIEGLDS